MNKPLVHVLIINWNGLEHLDECLDTLLAGTYENVKFVLLDNASTDGSDEYVRKKYGHDERVEVLHWKNNIGWSGGNNVGLEHALEAQAEYVFLINNDTATAPDAIEKLVEAAEEHSEIGALAPKMLIYDNPTLLNSIGIECSIIGCGWDLGIGRLDDERWDTPRQVIGVCGGAWFIRTKVLAKTGLLPAEFGIYSDDLDLGLRIWNAGYEIWSCPSAVIRHKFSATMGKGKRLCEKYYLNTRNRFRVLQRNFPISKILSVKIYALIGECRAIGRAILDGQYWKVLAHFKAWSASVGYFPTALGERWRRRRQGIGKCRFWHLIVKCPMFGPGLVLPEDGWYPEISFNGKKIRPMSSRATVKVETGKLRIFHVNCYPHVGATEIHVGISGQNIATLSTLDNEELIVDVPEGILDFSAQRIFYAEDTGESIDIGGWISVERV